MKKWSPLRLYVRTVSLHLLQTAVLPAWVACTVHVPSMICRPSSEVERMMPESRCSGLPSATRRGARKFFAKACVSGARF